MYNEQLAGEIRALKSELGELNDRMIQLRYQDFKEVFVEQMRHALAEEGSRSFAQGLDGSLSRTSCAAKAACEAKLNEVLGQAIEAFRNEDAAKALRLLDEVQGVLCGNESPCADDACSTKAAEAVLRVRTTLAVYGSLASALEARGKGAAPIACSRPEATPEEIEALLSPLSNAWRVKVLRLLREKDLGLTEISRNLGLEPGHVQFHIKALRASGYVLADRRSHLYSLSFKGQTALEGVEDLGARLE
jgi:DNA-binding transcriptional ArsR family regulator